MAVAVTDLYGLIGHPVAHSRSPLIHQRFAEQTGRALSYVLIDAAPGELRREVATFRDRGGRGLNVTLPYKGDACVLAAQLTDRARTARAVNTLTRLPDGNWSGDTTDGAGLVTDLTRNLGIDPVGRRILVMGAGGAARGAIASLLDAHPARIVIANRSVDRAAALARSVAHLGRIDASTYEALDERFDLVINATSASLAGAVPPLPAAVIDADSVCYDMVYANGPTVFLSWAAETGCRTLADGTGMLVEQAAESFRIWHGVRPDTAPVLDELRRLLSCGG